MRHAKILMCMVSMLAVAACDDSGITDPQDFGPSSVIRMVNVVTDRGTVDFRFIDRVENLPSLLGVPFRGYSGVYQRTHAGARPTRLFPNSTDPAVTQVILKDETFTLGEGARYTFVYAGQTAGGQDALVMLEDPAIPTPTGLALKVLHGAHNVGNVDVYIVPVNSATATTPADWRTNNGGVIANVGYLAQSGYANVSALTAGLYRFVVTAAGSATPLFEATPNKPGAAAPSGATYGPQPGVRISGSVMTLVLSSGTVPGSPGSTTGNQTPTAFLMIDKSLDP